MIISSRVHVPTEALTSPCLLGILCFVVLPHMINTQRRWSLPVILGSVVLLLAGTGLFLIARPAARRDRAAPKSVQEATATPSPTPSGERPAVERLG